MVFRLPFGFSYFVATLSMLYCFRLLLMTGITCLSIMLLKPVEAATPLAKILLISVSSQPTIRPIGLTALTAQVSQSKPQAQKSPAKPQAQKSPAKPQVKPQAAPQAQPQAAPEAVPQNSESAVRADSNWMWGIVFLLPLGFVVALAYRWHQSRELNIRSLNPAIDQTQPEVDSPNYPNQYDLSQIEPALSTQAVTVPVDSTEANSTEANGTEVSQTEPRQTPALSKPESATEALTLQPQPDQAIQSPTTKLAKVDIVEALVTDLHSLDGNKRRKAIWELGQWGDSRAIQPLVDLLVDADSQQRSLILAALSEISTRTLKPLNRALMLSLQDDSADVRKNAIRDVTRIYDLMTQVSQLLQYATSDSDEEVQETARWALGQLNRVQSARELEPPKIEPPQNR
jgi:hypothetical protein